MARQDVRRASSGWLDCSGSAVVDEPLGAELAVRPRLERSVSWTPGAEGAPLEGVVDVGCACEGVMRIAWMGDVSGWLLVRRGGERGSPS